VLPASGTVLPDRGISGNPSRSAQHAEVHFDELRRELLGLPEVAAVYVVVGSQDVLIHVAVRDVEHLRTLVGETLTSRRDIAHIETSLIFEFTRKPALPNYGEQ
jgi:DNA-binding Lrp family transcriptional regulator